VSGLVAASVGAVQPGPAELAGLRHVAVEAAPRRVVLSVLGLAGLVPTVIPPDVGATGL
jgi:hypothetical protein